MYRKRLYDKVSISGTKQALTCSQENNPPHPRTGTGFYFWTKKKKSHAASVEGVWRGSSVVAALLRCAEGFVYLWLRTAAKQQLPKSQHCCDTVGKRAVPEWARLKMNTVSTFTTSIMKKKKTFKNIEVFFCFWC